MNNLFSTFLQIQGFFPNVCHFLFDALKTTGIVFLGWSAASFLRSRSGVARCWVWRCTLLGVLTVLVFDFGPGAMQRIRLVFPVRMEREQAAAFWREANTLKLVRSQEEMSRLVEEKRANHTVVEAPPWEMDRYPHLTASDMLAQPWSRIEAWLPKVWWGVACAMILLSAFRIVSGVLWLRRGETDADKRMMALADDVASALAIKQRAKLRITSKIHSPLIMGIFRPSIFLPAAASSWGEQKLRAVFLHELSHWKRRDTLWKYLGRMASCLFWWNPFVALAARRMDAEAEIAADDAVLLRRYEAKSYAAVLVDIASENGNERISATGISMIGQRSLEKRIKALLADNPWRGRMGWLGTATVTVLFAAFMSGASIYLAHAATTDNAGKANPSKLTQAQRTDLERIVDANTKRISALRFIHFKMEIAESWESAGKTVKAPQPTILEAWTDEWTGIHRMEFRPKVSPWTDGAAPFYISDSTEIFDGKLSYSFQSDDDPSRIQGHKSQGSLQMAYLGLFDTNDLIHITKNMLAETLPPEDQWLYTVDSEMRDGKALTRIREQFLAGHKVTQQKTFLVDPSQDDMLVFSELSFPVAQPKEPTQWSLKKTGITENGTLYPELTETVSSFGGEKITSVRKVTSLQIIASLPPGTTDVPKPPPQKYVATTAVPVRHDSMAVSYVSAKDGSAVPSVSIKVRINGAPEQSLTTGKDGWIVIPLPKDEVKYLGIKADGSNFVRQYVEWRKYGDPLQLPESYEVKLFPSSPISGKVLNEEHQPIAGANVEVWINKGPRVWGTFRDGFNVFGIPVKTDATGTWTFKDAPEDLEGLDIRVSAPGYKSTEPTNFLMETGLPYTSLRDGSCVTTLQRGEELAGHVQDSSGKPVADCHLMIGNDRWGRDLPNTKTDAAGNFSFGGLPSGETWFCAESAGHKPFALQLTLPVKAPLKIALEPGNVLRGRVIKEDGTPLAGAKVGADQWKELRTLEFETQTDADGRFTWSGAPDEAVKFYFDGQNGREFLYGRWLTAGKNEQTIVMKPALRLIGKVVDASTGKPIPIVKITPGRVDGSDNDWEHESAKTCENGEIDWKTDRMGDKRIFLIEAEGYDSLQTKVFDTNQSEYNETFKLSAKKN